MVPGASERVTEMMTGSTFLSPQPPLPTGLLCVQAVQGRRGLWTPQAGEV